MSVACALALAATTAALAVVSFRGLRTLLRARRVTVVPGAPSLYRRLRSAAGVERALSSVRLMTSGAAPLDTGDFGVAWASD